VGSLRQIKQENPMLYNSKWNKPSLAGFVEWLKTRDPEARFDFNNYRHCAIGQYYKSIGRRPVVQVVRLSRQWGLGDAGLGMALDTDIFGQALTALQKLSK
jgi:hypothetical protein